MKKNKKGLDKICGEYEKLNDTEKGKIIRLAGKLMNCQEILQEEKKSLEKIEHKGSKKPRLDSQGRKNI